MLEELKYRVKLIEDKYKIPEEKRFKEIEFVEFYEQQLFESVLKLDETLIKLSPEAAMFAIGLISSAELSEGGAFITVLLRTIDSHVFDKQDEKTKFDASLKSRLVSYRRERLLA